MTTASGARFTIEGSPSSDAGYDATAGGTIDLQLEASPALDVSSCVYDIRLPTKNAPSLSLPGSGIASPPTSIVTMSIPGGVYAFVIRCRTNNGEIVTGADGKPDASVNTFERIVVVRSALTGLRKIIVGERLEYATPRGWTDAWNEMVDKFEVAASSSALGSKVFLAREVPGLSEAVSSPNILGERVVHEVSGALAATFVVNAKRASGAGIVSVDLFDGSTVLATLTTTSTSLVELSADVSSTVIGGGNMNLQARAYAAAGSTITATYAAIRYS